jgi:Hemopexin
MTIVDSAVLWPNGKIYFFSGDKYFRYDVANEAVDPDYPLPIQDHCMVSAAFSFKEPSRGPMERLTSLVATGSTLSTLAWIELILQDLYQPNSLGAVC